MMLYEARELERLLNPAVMRPGGPLRELYLDEVERGTLGWDTVDDEDAPFYVHVSDRDGGYWVR